MWCHFGTVIIHDPDEGALVYCNKLLLRRSFLYVLKLNSLFIECKRIQIPESWPFSIRNIAHEIRNTNSTDREFGIQYLESPAWNPGSWTFLECPGFPDMGRERNSQKLCDKRAVTVHAR